MRLTLMVSIAALAVTLVPSAARPSEGLARSGSYSLELIGEGGEVLPTFEHAGRSYVLGALGTRYSLRLRNGSGQRVELVAAVDGRDVLDGKPSAFAKRGYIVDPYGEVTIEGFRLSTESVAAFRFSSVARSYAARTGTARDVGVIGVAVFTERAIVPPALTATPWVHGLLGSSAEGEASDFSGAGATLPPTEMAPAPATRGGALADRKAKAASRPGLGTEFGEERGSHVDEVHFERAGSQPAVVLSLRYDDRQGLQAMGVDLGRYGAPTDVGLRESAEPFRRNVSFSSPPPGWEGR